MNGASALALTSVKYLRWFYRQSYALLVVALANQREIQLVAIAK